MRPLLIQTTPAIGQTRVSNGSRTPGQARRAASGERSRRQAAPQVLIVDDDPSSLGALGRLIKSAGLKVKLFDRPSALLNDELPTERACVILDMSLPEMNGVTLHEVLHTTGHALPTIFVTGLTDPATQRQLQKADPVAILYKPVHERVLFEAIRMALNAGATH